MRVPVVGRFAPSPTGALHWGSLATATASYLDARQRGGRWLLRIEDLDSARTVPGAADAHIQTLAALGFTWDGEIVHQSRRLALYADALQSLASRDLAYPCSCSRRDLGATDDVGGYPGTCRAGPTRSGPTATRFRADQFPFESFIDRVKGLCGAGDVAGGDPIVRRRDGLDAYQLAVVVDDADQGVTDLVRGADLFKSTGWQQSLQKALALPQPHYAHVPLVCEPDGAKLSKSARSLGPPESLTAHTASALMWRILVLLRQQPPAALSGSPLRELWPWAIQNWRLDALCGVTSLRAEVT